MPWEPSESDGPEVIWAREHDHELVGMAQDVAAAIVSAAGFRVFLFHPSGGGALAAMKVSNSVTLISDDEGIVRLVRT